MRLPNTHTGYEWKKRGLNTCSSPPLSYLQFQIPARVVGLIKCRLSLRHEAPTNPLSLTSRWAPTLRGASMFNLPRAGTWVEVWVGGEKVGLPLPKLTLYSIPRWP